MASSVDEKFMKMALAEARKASRRGDFPVGAVLVMEGKVIGKFNNALLSKQTWGHHAETSVILEASEKIRARKTKNPDAKIELYSTLEPCLMCFGSAILHRVNRIVFSCRDPRGGATGLLKRSLPGFYADNWPIIESGIFKEQAYPMLDTWMAEQSSERWQKNRVLFKKMVARWK